MRLRNRMAFAALATLALSAGAAAQDAPLRVVATTTIAADIAQNVAGDLLTIETLLPPDTDTHAYEPTIDDANRLAGADLLLTVGAGYESFIESLIENAGVDIPVVELNTGVEIIAFSGEHAHEGEEHAGEGDHDHEHEHEEITDLSTWEGEWVSGWSFGVDAMQPAFDAILATTPELTLDDILAYYETGNQTAFDTMTVEGQTVTFTGADGSVTCAYELHGSEPIPQVPGETWTVFETADAGCEAYATLLLNPPHASEEGSSPHFHFRYGAGEHDEVIADSSPWFPSLYPAGTTIDEVMGGWIAGARSVALYIGSVQGIEIALTEEEAAAMEGASEEAAMDEHDHEAHSGFEVLGVLGEELECGEHGHDHEKRALRQEDHDHEHEEECDPHTWMNPLNAAVWAQNVADALSAADPANAEAYAANAAAYIAELEAVDAEIEALVAQIPEESRVLVTNHEFMGYFAARYGFEVAATVLPGGTTGTEVDPQALAELIALIEAEGVPAIFAEVTANPQLAEIVAQDAGITVVSTLYSESLSDASGPAATYLDYLRYNAQAIVDALAG